jgi:hypothetical protein
MDNLIEQYKKAGDFTQEQKCQFFIKPSNDILNMILESDDFNFRKTCIAAIIDYNVDKDIKKDFMKNPVIIETMRKMLFF